MASRLSPWNILISLAGALSLFNLIADFEWLALSETAQLWLDAYRQAVAILFRPLAPLLARAEFEFTEL